jgi:hypothetical protein
MWNTCPPPKDRTIIAISADGRICRTRWDGLRGHWRRIEDETASGNGGRMLGLVFWAELPDQFEAVVRHAMEQSFAGP